MRRIHIAALLLVGTALAACGTSSATDKAPDKPPPSTVATTVAPVTTTAPTTVPTTEAEPDYSTAQETLDRWATAIGASDIDAAMATHRFNPDDLETDRESMSYLAVSINYAEFSDCQFSTLSSSGRIQAQCELTLIDPILVATGMETVRVSWQLSEDGKAILVSEPGYRLSPKRLFVSYSKDHYPEEFAEACGPNTVNYNALVGWAFNRACGEFTAEIANEVADAIKEAG